ncbi:hypothetical protein FNV43_RR02139 [Rhamnella rubrinervis]|uniref:F-box domain-containing protein n=1 Tax=Rhamnella rubrinervis TaxID=2594499 RepID=A0A8K0HRT5_9ROSA|nr:hypothetical protein FNV43_RR02139 [Rhamnella rubrinervis]
MAANNWSELPTEIVKLILKKLPFIGTFSFEAVCLSWNIAARSYTTYTPTSYSPPLLLLEEQVWGDPNASSSLLFLYVERALVSFNLRIPTKSFCVVVIYGGVLAITYVQVGETATKKEGRIPTEQGREAEDGGMSGATVVGKKKSSQTQQASLEVPSQLSQGLFGGSARKSTGLQGGAIITWFGEGLARTSEPGDGSVVMVQNNFPWLECGKS